MTYENVLLRLETYQVQTYNVIIAALVINAVDSGRCDEVSGLGLQGRQSFTDDGLGLYVPPQGWASSQSRGVRLNPHQNAEHLRSTVENMWNSLFWHADAEFFDKELEGHYHKASKALDKAIRHGRVSEQDLGLLKQAIDLL